MDDLASYLRARLDEENRPCEGDGEYQSCTELSEQRRREGEARREQIDLMQYLAGWTGEHDSGVTEHEISTMRGAARALGRTLALPYAHRADCRQEWVR